MNLTIKRRLEALESKVPNTKYVPYLVTLREDAKDPEDFHSRLSPYVNPGLSLEEKIDAHERCLAWHKEIHPGIGAAFNTMMMRNEEIAIVELKGASKDWCNQERDVARRTYSLNEIEERDPADRTKDVLHLRSILHPLKIDVSREH